MIRRESETGGWRMDRNSIYVFSLGIERENVS
jgi:hypothetical protein